MVVDVFAATKAEELDCAWAVLGGDEGAEVIGCDGGVVEDEGSCCMEDAVVRSCCEEAGELVVFLGAGDGTCGEVEVAVDAGGRGD